jgi:hypothetical protein
LTAFVFAPKFWPCAHLITTFTIGGGTKSVEDVRSEVIKSYITRSGIESALSGMRNSTTGRIALEAATAQADAQWAAPVDHLRTQTMVKCAQFR